MISRKKKPAMGSFKSSLVVVVVLVVSSAVGGMAATYSVVDRGAKGDGVTDDVKAFEETWSATCGDSSGSPTFLVPAGRTFLLSQKLFAGPCKSSVHVKIDGRLKAPDQPWTAEWNFWIAFKDVEGLSLDGSGEIDGQGQVWWNCKKNNQCLKIPNSLYILGCNNFKLSGLKFKNSPRKHISIDEVTGGQVSEITITAPDESPNTDGIYLEHAQLIQISNSNISTGDDCVAIGPYSSYINITNLVCGPGHGISIGSLGADGSEAEVEQIHVSKCSFVGTQNGVRIKTWQGGSGYAREISFTNILFSDVKKPIVIDQYYCNGGSNCPNKTSAVQVSNVYYSHLNGTTNRDFAIILECSETSPCTGITMENINIRPSSGRSQDFKGSVCVNAKGKKKELVAPEVSCLSF